MRHLLLPFLLLYSTLGISQSDVSYWACPGTTVTLEMPHVEGVTYQWFDSSNNPIGSGDNINVAVGASNMLFYVDSSSVVKPITIKISESCGGPLSECAKNGTVLFRETFGGDCPNSESCPEVSTTPLSSDIISYSFVTGLTYGGEYRIAKSSYGGEQYPPWHKVYDHTSPDDPDQGYLLQANAAKEKGQFYKYEISNLCPGTKLYFSAWIMSLLVHNNDPDKANMIFVIEDTNGHVISKYFTGNIPDADPTWKEYGFEFVIPEDQSAVVFRIINNGTGFLGNDFVLDDITIKLCSTTASLDKKVIKLCENETANLAASYSDDGTFGEHVSGRWYKSTSGNVNDLNEWTAVAGSDFVSSDGKINELLVVGTDLNVGDTAYYRYAVSASGNLDKDNCRSMSAPAQVIVLKYTPDASGVLYVDSRGSGDGSSWASPITELADALHLIERCGKNGVDEIRVAQGTYYPLYGDSSSNRNKAFTVTSSLRLLGSFKGGTEADANDRDTVAYKTTISGDLNKDDLPEAKNRDDNSFHVLIALLDAGEIIVDGFTVTGGNANGGGSITINSTAIQQSFGGGVYAKAASAARITISNTNIYDNYASISGGGVYAASDN